MSATDVADRETTNVEHVCDLVKSVADRSADPEAAYEAFLLGLEMGLVYRDQATIQEPTAGRTNTSSAAPEPRKATIRKAPRLIPAEDDNFPTEWTLYP